MKIYSLPVSSEFQPDKQNIISSPLQSRNVEQDFFEWLPLSGLTTDDPAGADWDYLPVFCGRYWVNHNFGATGMDELQGEVLRLVSRHRPTFTVADFDAVDLLSGFDFCGMAVFTSSRRSDNGSVDVPLLCLPHQRTYASETKVWLASFVGNLSVGPRAEMAEALSGRGDCFVKHSGDDSDLFENAMLSSHVALCPRGHGGSSFRFFEAMQMGTVPYFIGWPDTRPFKRIIDWDSCSLYAGRVSEMAESLDTLSLATLLEMGREAKRIYDEHLAFGKWCQHALEELAWLN